MVLLSFFPETKYVESMKINKSDCGNDEKCCKSSFQAFVCTQRDAHILSFCGIQHKRAIGYIQSAAREK